MASCSSRQRSFNRFDHDFRPVRVRLPIEQVSEGTVTELKALLSAHPGDSEVYLHLGERQVLRLPSDFCVDPSSGLGESSSSSSSSLLGLNRGSLVGARVDRYGLTVLNFYFQKLVSIRVVYPS